MKTSLIRILQGGFILLSLALCPACEDINEVPPRPESSIASRRYKLPDPVVLNAEEAEIIRKIQQEFQENIP